MHLPVEGLFDGCIPDEDKVAGLEVKIPNGVRVVSLELECGLVACLVHPLLESC